VLRFAVLRFVVLRFVPPRLAVLRFAPPRLAAPRFAIAGPRDDFVIERFAVDDFRAPRLALFFAAPRFAVFFAPPRLAALLFFAPARLLIAGPRRALFFPALRFMPRPDFLVAIAASPLPVSGYRCCANRVSR
jgi:hypothetical protein